MNNVGSVAFFPSEKTSNGIFYQGWKGKKEHPRSANKIKVRAISQNFGALWYQICFTVCETESRKKNKSEQATILAFTALFGSLKTFTAIANYSVFGYMKQ